MAWMQELKEKLISTYGQKTGNNLFERYQHVLPANYLAECTPSLALSDIEYLELLSADKPLEISFYQSQEDPEHPLHLRLFQWQRPIPLSDILPMLENLDLRIDNANPTKIFLENQQSIWISDFTIIYSDPTVDFNNILESFQEAFPKIYYGLAENDGFNKLVLGASLSWREIMVLRAYAKYLKQIGFRFSQTYIEKALIANAEITKQLIQLFLSLHNPSATSTKSADIEAAIETALEKVSSLDEDRIIRRLLSLIKATLRTNYFQVNADKQPKEYLSLKFNSHFIPELPLPIPMYEIFVYSTRFEAIHLRHSKVARGGIRWSDRLEDFRTEVLGLMKAQTVKNAVIVPSGAKGGFVLKLNSASIAGDLLKAEVVRCYQSFICGLLDLTDNILNGKIIRPENVVCHDEADTYLVVAADKGTASFSDIANAISAQYNFWLGDAFASGGSAGYDHKKMGITAKGAWESIKRHFRELEINIAATDISVVGVGDMSGDVFGNGMLYSQHIKLVAAFDHRHIFIDPTPDPIISYQERARLFNLPTSSWQDYNSQLISKGGGVFKRNLKSIPLSPEIQTTLGITEETLTPTDLISAILKAPVDLLFNGGIGTYVKASTENHIDVGDRTNDYCRINGEELRCKVVGEGGNLGFTQRGRIEYSLKGGLINTDFIDNSAGVDCSDHEVNLKILLNAASPKNKLSDNKRTEFLSSFTEEISQLVLNDNYHQALVMSFSVFHAQKNFNLHCNYIKELETIGILNRKIEFLPDDKTLLERKNSGFGLTRPELAVLLAYTKIYIQQEILKSNLPEDNYLNKIISTAFPPSIARTYQQNMQEHKLKREIIATQLSNNVVNEMGITFVYRLQMETGAEVAEIIRAFAVASHIFGTDQIQKVVEHLDFQIPMSEQYEMLYNIRQLINLSTRWFLLSRHMRDDLEKLILHYAANISKIKKLVPTLMSGATKIYLHDLIERFSKAGIASGIAESIATYRAIYTVLNIVDLATIYKFDVVNTAKLYFACGEKLSLVWFRDQIACDSREGHWNTLARLTLRDELDIAQRVVTTAIMKKSNPADKIDELINNWIANNTRGWQRWQHMLEMLHASTNIDYTMFFIAIRELTAFILASED